MPTRTEQKNSSHSQKLASFIQGASYEQLSPNARLRLKSHLLDSLGCAIAALNSPPIRDIQRMISECFGVRDFDKQGSTNELPCTLWGFPASARSEGLKGVRSSPQVAAFYNGCLVRYLDFMDGYTGKKQSCHPSDNVASLVAAAEFSDSDGEDFLTAMAISYQIQCRLIDSLPISQKGFDHTVQLGLSIVGGCAKMLGLDHEQTVNAIGICGASSQGLDITRSAYLSNWKGLASAETALNAVQAVFLARSGVTGPKLVFEGPRGLFDALKENEEVDWEKEDLERVTDAILKEYNVELHDQSLIEGVIELREREGINPSEIDKVEVQTVKIAYDITGGGGSGGDKYIVYTKDQADHSIPYAVAVSLIDGDLYPEQYTQERIMSEDVQSLLRRVSVRENKVFTKSYPDKFRCKVTIAMNKGSARRHFEIEKQDYEGFRSRPMPRDKVEAKFRRLTRDHIDSDAQDSIMRVVYGLESMKVSDLIQALTAVRSSSFETHTRQALHVQN